jgi:hypothetical protein
MGWPGPRRVVAIRRPIPEEPSWPVSFFRRGRYGYLVIVTDRELTPLHLWRFSNDRAEAELVIRELKDADALGKLPSRRWAANAAYVHRVVFADNLLNWFRRLCGPPPWQRWSLRILRHRLLLVPAELVRPQGNPTLKRPEPFPHQQAFWATLKRLERLAL